MLTLWDYAPSPHCARVRIALALAQLRYRKLAVELDGDDLRQPRFEKRTPFRTVPLLVDGEVAIAQSYAALLWIGDQRPGLVGRGAHKARVLAWLAASATELDPPVRRAYELAFFTRRPERRTVDQALAGVRATLVGLEAARAREPRGDFAVGDAPSLADAALLPSLWLLRDLADDFPRKVPVSRWPWWNAWFERLRARPEIAAALGD